MIKNYFITAFRHLLNNRATTTINIAGLTIGITFTLVIMVVVQYEFSFDSYHTNAENIYRITRVSMVDGKTEYRTGAVYPLADAFREKLTSVEGVAAMQYEGGIQVTLVNDEGTIEKKYQENEGFVFLEPSFFGILDYKGKGVKWLSGNPANALKEPNSVVLAEDLARKYFPGEEALGKTILLDNRQNFKVTGVISNLPVNTDFPFKIMASYVTLTGLMGEFSQNWYGMSDQNQVVLILKDGVTKGEVEAQIAAIHASNVDARTADFRKYLLQPLSEVHTDNRFGNYNGRTVSTTTIWSLALVAFFLLIMACINFINLTTAQAVIRGKEVGIRKALGGKRKQLVYQFLGETFLITLTATIIAVVIAELLLLLFQDFFKVNLNHFIIADPVVFSCVVLILIFVTLLAGFYPAILQSGFNPVLALKSKLGNNSIKGIQLRKGLVSFQLVISQVFIICTIIVVKQMDYFRNADLGFDKEAVLTINLPQNNIEKLQSLKDQLESSSAIKSVSFSSSFPSGTGRNTSFQDIYGKDMDRGGEGIVFEHQSIDENYLSTYQVDLLAGRNFLPADTAGRMIINLQLSNRLGFSQPEEAIGQEVISGNTIFTVIGVTENFHTKSLRDQIDYVAFTFAPQRFYNASIKLSTPADNTQFLENLSGTIAHIEGIYNATFPEYVFDYSFIDERIKSFYAEETRLSDLFKVLAGLSVFIGCLGLYGLVSFMAVRRGKEMGIRKVLGASIGTIITLFSKDFILLVLIAFGVATPLAWYMMHKWLQDFVFRIDIGLEIFLLAGLASLFIALITIGYQSLKTSWANPVKSLRSE